MNKKLIRKVIRIFTVLCVIGTIINVSYNILLPTYLSVKYNTDVSDVNSIGIIGGSDRPATIFVSNSKSSYITILFAVLSIVGTAYLIITKRKQDNQK